MDTKEIALQLVENQSPQQKRKREAAKKALLSRKDITLHWIEQNGKFIHHDDEVVIRNNVGKLAGPYEVLGFTSDGKNVYMDKDIYWLPVPIENVVVVITKLEKTQS